MPRASRGAGRVPAIEVRRKSAVLATPGGLEPPTFSLEGCCSIH
jgi:hypothetical protein